MAPQFLPWERRLFDGITVNYRTLCWEAKSRSYGNMQIKGRIVGRHRQSYELYRGPIPAGLFVLHDCPHGDNPRCCNPFHLKTGNLADNSADMAAKGRSLKGDRNPSRQPGVAAKRRGDNNGNNRFTADTILAILYSPLGQKMAAAHFGCAASWVQRVRKREVWPHLEVDPSLIPPRRFFLKAKTIAKRACLLHQSGSRPPLGEPEAPPAQPSPPAGGATK